MHFFSIDVVRSILSISIKKSQTAYKQCQQYHQNLGNVISISQARWGKHFKTYQNIESFIALRLDFLILILIYLFGN